MNPKEDDFLGIPSTVLLPAGVSILLALVFFFPQRGNPPPAPPAYLGCYSADGAPDIVVDRQKMRVMQTKAVEVAYALEYHKGWALSIERELNFIGRADRAIEIVGGETWGNTFSYHGKASSPLGRQASTGSISRHPHQSITCAGATNVSHELAWKSDHAPQAVRG